MRQLLMPFIGDDCSHKIISAEGNTGVAAVRVLNTLPWQCNPAIGQRFPHAVPAQKRQAFRNVSRTREGLLATCRVHPHS